MLTLHVTRQLARKIEETEGRNHSVFTQALDLLNSKVQACCSRIGGGAVFFVDEIAILASASTLLKHRGRGVQKALISARVKDAQERRCNLAVVVTEPGTVSQHNVEKLGFRVLYTRTKFMKKHDPESA